MELSDKGPLELTYDSTLAPEQGSITVCTATPEICPRSGSADATVGNQDRETQGAQGNSGGPRKEQKKSRNKRKTKKKQRRQATVRHLGSAMETEEPELPLPSSPTLDSHAWDKDKTPSSTAPSCTFSSVPAMTSSSATLCSSTQQSERSALESLGIWCEAEVKSLLRRLANGEPDGTLRGLGTARRLQAWERRFVVLNHWPPPPHTDSTNDDRLSDLESPWYPERQPPQLWYSAALRSLQEDLNDIDTLNNQVDFIRSRGHQLKSEYMSRVDEGLCELTGPYADVWRCFLAQLQQEDYNLELVVSWYHLEFRVLELEDLDPPLIQRHYNSVNEQLSLMHVTIAIVAKVHHFVMERAAADLGLHSRSAWKRVISTLSSELPQTGSPTPIHFPVGDHQSPCDVAVRDSIKSLQLDFDCMNQPAPNTRHDEHAVLDAWHKLVATQKVGLGRSLTGCPPPLVAARYPLSRLARVRRRLEHLDLSRSDAERMVKEELCLVLFYQQRDFPRGSLPFFLDLYSGQLDMAKNIFEAHTPHLHAELASCIDMTSRPDCPHAIEVAVESDRAHELALECGVRVYRILAQIVGSDRL